MVRLVLGSSSPRRKEIMGYFTYPFEQASPPFDEESIPFEGDPKKYACTLAEGKALSLQSQYPKAAILTADTVVYMEGKIYGKPRDEKEAFQTLSALSGYWHEVYTGISLVFEEQHYSAVEVTNVLFHDLTQRQIQKYLGAGIWHDKAGGYTVQKVGSLLIKEVNGCFYNVIGFPITSVRELLQKIGIDLWDYVT